MKKHTKSQPTLGDMILAFSSQGRPNREMISAVSDLLESGRVKLTTGRRTIRARVV